MMCGGNVIPSIPWTQLSMKAISSLSSSPGAVLALSRPLERASISLILEMICMVLRAGKLRIAVR